MSLSITIILEVAIFNATFIARCMKITEGGLIRPGRSSLFSERERCVLDPLVVHPNPVVMASQTRLDGSRADLCRRPCRVVFIQKHSIDP